MSVPLKPGDPAYWMLEEGRAKVESGEGIKRSPVYDELCYICRDPEFALMGLPLCTACPVVTDGVQCGAHTPADDVVCAAGHTDPRYIDAMEELHDEPSVSEFSDWDF